MAARDLSEGSGCFPRFKLLEASCRTTIDSPAPRRVATVADGNGTRNHGSRGAGSNGSMSERPTMMRLEGLRGEHLEAFKPMYDSKGL